MSFTQLFSETEERNIPLTAALQENPIYSNYLEWLQTNGCIFPSVSITQVEYPVAFGAFGTMGCAAKASIPVQKAFLFIPMELVITPDKAKNSEIGHLFKEHKTIFTSSSMTYDYILWVYLVYERLKGAKGFYFHYFNVIGAPETLMDWDESEILSLQDEWVAFERDKLLAESLRY